MRCIDDDYLRSRCEGGAELVEIHFPFGTLFDTWSGWRVKGDENWFSTEEVDGGEVLVKVGFDENDFVAWFEVCRHRGEHT